MYSTLKVTILAPSTYHHLCSHYRQNILIETHYQPSKLEYLEVRIDVPNSCAYFSQTPICEWYVVKCDSKGKDTKKTLFIRD